MIRSCLIGLGVLLAGFFAASADEPPALAEARRLEQTLQQAIEKAEPAVACLLIYRTSPSANHPKTFDNTALPEGKVPDSFGSGVVIDPQGLILTNYHVVRDAVRGSAIRVRLMDRDETMATLIAGDNFSDLAVLKISSPPRGLPTIPLGNGERLRKGSWVIALGHPYAAGFRDGSPSASSGIVSNLRRRLPTNSTEFDRKGSLLQYGTMIQTDARLQLGQSGGAMVDLEGRLVGLTTAQAALTGYEMAGGFAMAIDANLRRIIEVLARGDEVEYGFLGVQTEATAPGGLGLELRHVVPNSPAFKVGLQMRDVIMEVNGQPIREQDDLFLHLGASLAGRKAVLKIHRPTDGVGRTFTVEPVLAKAAPKDKNSGFAKNRPRAIYGLRVDYTSVIAGQSSYVPDGVVVREFQEANAKTARLTEYVDIITHVNGKAVNTPAEFYREAERAFKAGESLKLSLNSGKTETLP